MSNRRASNINQNLRRESLMICFREAIQSSDARDRRTDIGKSLRLADMNSIDGLEVLFKVLKEKYEPLMPLEKRQISLVSPAPIHNRPNILGASPRGEWKCVCCGQEFLSAKALSGHGPQRCLAKNNRTK